MIPDYIRVLFRGRKLLFLRYMCSSFGKAFAALLLVMMIQQFLAVTHHKEGAFALFISRHAGHDALLIVMALLLVTVNLLSALLGYDNRITQQRVSEILEMGLMERIIRHLLTLSVQFFKTHTDADLVQAVRVDVTNLRVMANCYATIVRNAMLSVSLAAVVFWLSPLLSFVSLVALPFVFLPLLAYSSKRLRLASRQLRATSSYLFSTIFQIIAGIRIIKAYGAEESEARVSRERAERFFNIHMSVVRLQALIQVALESVGGLSLVAVITVGGYQVSKGRMTWESMVAFVFASRSLFGPLYEIHGSITELHTLSASKERIRELLDTKPDIADRPNARPLLAPPEVISFENINFSYDNGPQVLHNVSFQIRAGETVGIVGPSGAGKTTLLNLIVRFYDPSSGHVRYDGVDLREFRIADVYSGMAIVAQDPFLFSTTVRNNIRCARPDASDEEVEEAAKAASIHNEIMEMPQGYETVLGMGGRDLSRGQAQRVNVARALLRNPRLLLLDEATASLDSVAEAQVQHSIDHLMVGRTCFIVAHRLSTLRNADRLIMMERGRCIGFGTHEELIRDCGLYRQFWELQRLGHDDMDFISSMIPRSPEPEAIAESETAPEPLSAVE